MTPSAFARSLAADCSALFTQLPATSVDQIQTCLKAADLWEAATLLGAAANTVGLETTTAADCFAGIGKIREFQGERAESSCAPTTVVFGTSGWRGIIGEDFTMLNVHKVVHAITEMMRTETFLNVNGYSSFEQVQQAGICLFRDNRFMGDAFMDAATAELARAGVRILRAGECPTGVGSALVTELKAAGSINFTPSHNPMPYAGLKFNPADGGPADTNLTSIIEEQANALMAEDAAFTPATNAPGDLLTEIDAAAIFTTFLETKSRVFDLPKLRTWLCEQAAEICLVIDNMHGASRGYVQRILGDDTIAALKAANAIQFLNTNDDYSFHGLKPEPSAANQAPLMELLRASGRPLTLAVALDPDADRIRFADSAMDIDMNHFGPLAYASLCDRGICGGAVSTVASTDFGFEIAKQLGQPVFETSVGFKNFRPILGADQAVIAFEESDGISFIGHTLEKCAVAGFLAALEAMAATGTNLSDQFAALQKRFGYFYPEKAGTDVKGVSVEAWQAYKKAVVSTLETLFRVGDTVAVGDAAKKIVEIVTKDGVKLLFADKSWLLLRPSGTEPKFRYYFELVSATPLADEAAALAPYEQAAAGILAKARAAVDQG